MKSFLSFAYYGLHCSCLLFIIIIAAEAKKTIGGQNSDETVETEGTKVLPLIRSNVGEGSATTTDTYSGSGSDQTVEINLKIDQNLLKHETGKSPIKYDIKLAPSAVTVVVEKFNDANDEDGKHKKKKFEELYVGERVPPAGEQQTDRQDMPTKAADDEQYLQQDDKQEILPDIPGSPAIITLTDKNADLLLDSSLDDVDEDEESASLNSNHNETENERTATQQQEQHNIRSDDTVVILSVPKTVKKEFVLPQEIQPDEIVNKVDDTGGTGGISSTTVSDEMFEGKIKATNDIPGESITTTRTITEIPENLTTEEHPIPVFSEWAQKQMEQDEKQQEKLAVNTSMKKNTTVGNKTQQFKKLAKNYASPDCGAKIISSNSEAQNTGALLTNSKDEYMLSPCTNRIWFVVELCEAIQAEKIDLANFELFSSSPKNFSVAVTNRFPSREWSNVGRFIAEDQRNVQTFDLYPHLFGKFVRVDIHSHYNSEHFCPISLFRVYGTSEFEAFETENRLPEDDDDIDDDETLEQGYAKNENNLFKSASDAVMSMVKKAAEALVKMPSPNKTDVNQNVRFARFTKHQQCFTPKYNFKCDKCSENFVNNVNYLLSCRYNQLTSFLSIEALRKHLTTSQICANRFSLDTLSNFDFLGCKESLLLASGADSVIDERQSFFLSTFPYEYLAAMCHILTVDNKSERNSSLRGSDVALNLTIDQKTGDKLLNVNDLDKDLSKKIPITAKISSNEKNGKNNELNPSDELKSTEDSLYSEEPPPVQIPQPPTDVHSSGEVKRDEGQGVNIFNFKNDPGTESIEEESNTIKEELNDSKSSAHSMQKSTEDNMKSKEIETDSHAWEHIESILQEPSPSENPIDSGGIVYSSPHKPQSESVFLRLSNRVKALERNMSLSGQYLEELSRRYKKQVEELQQSFAKTLTAIEEQNRRTAEREQQLFVQNQNLREVVEELSNRLNSWISLVICLGSFVFFQIILAWYLIRSFRRQQLHVLQNLEESVFVKKRSNNTRKLFRRRSVEGVSGHPTPTHKVRRPSEEAMRVVGSYKDLLIFDDGEILQEELRDVIGAMTKKTATKHRERKSSVFYGRRIGPFEPNVEDSEYSNQYPSEHVDILSKIQKEETANTDTVADDINLDDDYETYLPGSDLAYNEFMPDGPSAAQVIPVNGKLSPITSDRNLHNKPPEKIRRLSSPGFLKSPFGRSSGNKKSPHTPTGWEWYRLKKQSSPTNSNTTESPAQSSQKQRRHSKKDKSKSPENRQTNGFGNNSSTPNSSISELLPISVNGSEDSIRSSSVISTNSQTSKRQGSFKRIFRKIF